MTEFAGRLQPEDTNPFYTQERCYISEWLNNSTSPEVSLAQCRVVPGETTQLHLLTVQERYVVQQGYGLMELRGEDSFAIGPGDVVVIPAGCPQRVRNTGEVDLLFLCVCTPRFEPKHYEVLESTSTPTLEMSA